MNKLIFLTLFSGSVFAAGQGMYLEVNSHIPGSYLTVDSSQCMGVAPTTVINQRQYVEALDSVSCMFKDSKFDISLWENSNKIASYSVKVSVYGSRITNVFKNNIYELQS